MSVPSLRERMYAWFFIPPVKSNESSYPHILFHFTPERMNQISLCGKMALCSFVVGGSIILSGDYNCQPDDSSSEKCTYFVNLMTMGKGLLALSVLCCAIIARIFVKSWDPEMNRRKES
jgi:hypothetical protein